MAYVTTFATPLNNAASTVGAGGYTSGSGTLNLASGGGGSFPNPTSPNYYRVTVIQAAFAYVPSASSSNYTIFKVTGVSGDILTISGTLDGTTDRNYAAGDVVEIRYAAGNFSDIHTRVLYDAAMNADVYVMAGGL